MNGDICILCKDNYILVMGNCITIPKHISEGCEQTSYYRGISLHDLNCEICREGWIFEDLYQKDFCVEK